MDFTLYGGGTVYLLTPVSDAARAWVEEHLPEDRQTLGDGIAVEYRFVRDIVEGLQGDGLVVTGRART